MVWGTGELALSCPPMITWGEHTVKEESIKMPDAPIVPVPNDGGIVGWLLAAGAGTIAFLYRMGAAKDAALLKEVVDRLTKAEKASEECREDREAIRVRLAALEGKYLHQDDEESKD